MQTLKLIIYLYYKLKISAQKTYLAPTVLERDNSVQQHRFQMPLEMPKKSATFLGSKYDDTRCQRQTSSWTSSRRPGQIVQGSSNGTKWLWLGNKSHIIHKMLKYRRLQVDNCNPAALRGDQAPEARNRIRGIQMPAGQWAESTFKHQAGPERNSALDGLQRHLSTSTVGPDGPHHPELERHTGVTTFPSYSLG